MAKKELCQIGKEINHALVDINQTKEWLVSEVRTRTNLYFDHSYLHKIETGELATPKIIRAIRDILNLPDGD